MRYFTTRKTQAVGGGAALGCVLIIGLASGCAAPSAADGRLGTPVTATASARPAASGQPVDTADQALVIALAAAGLTNDQVTGVEVRQETEDGTLVWDVEFVHDGQKIEVDVRCSDGTVVDRDGRHATTTAPAGTTVMSVDQAKQIVAGRVPNATSIHIEADHHHGQTVYEGDVIASGQKYEFTIDAVTGEVLEWEADDLD